MTPFAFTFGFMPPQSPTPTLYGDVINYATQVDREIAALNSDMKSAIETGKPALSQEFVLQRNAFADEWKLFFASYQSWFWISFPSSAWDQVGQYEAKNEAWREKFKALGGTSIGPGPQDRPAPPDVVGAVKWGAAAVIAAAAAYVAYQAGWFK